MALYEPQNSVLVFNNRLDEDTAKGRSLLEIIKYLQSLNLKVILIDSCNDADSAMLQYPAVDCVLMDWDPFDEIGGVEAIQNIRSRNHLVPIFLSSSPDAFADLPLDVVRMVDEYVWIMQDTADFIAGRIEAAAKRYAKTIFPPMFKALVEFSEDYEYSWHTPGHEGGVAFLKSPSGNIFHQFFGEQLLRSDISISVGELGSLLDHSGPIGEGERYASQVFGSDQTYYVVMGGSGSNRIVVGACVTEGDTVLVDRNCHKSLEHAHILTGSRPVWLVPIRNSFGIIGPIPTANLTPQAIAADIAANPLVQDKQKPVVFTTITNSTYDGVCYRTPRVEELLAPVTSRLHYDEAWYGYARFNPIYQDRYAMRDGTRPAEAPTLFASQSAHKLLAALSQASMIHIKQGRQPIEHARFNESFMMHNTTSPLYPIIASCDVSAKMMEGAMGLTLTTDSIREAVQFRKEMARIKTALQAQDEKDWWFGMWQPDQVKDPQTQQSYPFQEAPSELLCTEPGCWVLHPDQEWHGFSDLEEDYAMLDPIKVTVLTPGISVDGSFEAWGIPAALLVKYLDEKGIVNEKSGDYNILFLFSIGVTKGKWGTLITRFFEFKKLFDENTRLELVFPDLVEAHPQHYAGLTLPTLAQKMHDFKRDSRQLEQLSQSFSTLPPAVVTPAESYRCLVRGQVERVTLEEAQGRVVATSLVPYPPGIPLLMGGERADTLEGPFLGYLKTLQDFDNLFPGFEHDIHGIENKDGHYCLYVIKER